MKLKLQHIFIPELIVGIVGIFYETIILDHNDHCFIRGMMLLHFLVILPVAVILYRKKILTN